MKLVDTVVLIGFLDPTDKQHRGAIEHLESVSSDESVFVPSSSLLEADLVMKSRGYSEEDRDASWQALASMMPENKVVPNSAKSIRDAVQLQRSGLDYFDSLIASLAGEMRAEVITTDRELGQVTTAEW